MKILFSMILFLVLASPAHASWTKKDTVYQLTYTVLHLIDWGQTLDVARNPDKFIETNFMLSKHPSVGQVNTYFIASLIGHSAVSYVLPVKANVFGYDIKPRRIWQAISIVDSGSSVINNFSIGVKVRY